MGTADRDAREIHGKIVYFGAAGAGKTSNLGFIQRKLKREHRGELKRLTTREGVASHETLPVQLGAVRGYKTSIQISSVPGAADATALRRQLVDGVDGIVFVADLRPERHDATLAALAELRQHLAAQGRKLEDVPLVVQYNRRDQADENAVERLHRRLGMRAVSCFEARADEGTGVLQTLTTLSKLVLLELRKAVDDTTPQPRAAQPKGASPPRPVRTVEPVEPLSPPTGEVTAAFESALGDKGFQIESAGPVGGGGNELVIPVRLIDEVSGRRVEIAVRIAIDSR
jgi:mutual gliding-motility protein MglA